MCFSKNVEGSRKGDILRVLNMRGVDRHEKYLGLPTIIGRSKKAVFACQGSGFEKAPRLEGKIIISPWARRYLSKL